MWGLEPGLVFVHAVGALRQIEIHEIWEGDSDCRVHGREGLGKNILKWEPWGYQEKHQLIIPKHLQCIFLTISMVSSLSAFIVSYSFRHFPPLLFPFSASVDCPEWFTWLQISFCCCRWTMLMIFLLLPQFQRQMLSFYWSKSRIVESVSDAFYSWA